VVNGSQWFTKDYTVDGTSGTSSIRGDSMETGPSMEAIQELQAQTSGIDSASAITNGGVMSFTLKSGTNKFHGSTFGYGHNEFLDANSWTNDLTGEVQGPCLGLRGKYRRPDSQREAVFLWRFRAVYAERLYAGNF
jgi:hypothetical protein